MVTKISPHLNAGEAAGFKQNDISHLMGIQKFKLCSCLEVDLQTKNVNQSIIIVYPDAISNTKWKFLLFYYPLGPELRLTR